MIENKKTDFSYLEYCMTRYMCQFQRGKANVQNHEAFLFVIKHVIEMVTAVLKRNVATCQAVAIEPASVLVGVYSGVGGFNVCDRTCHRDGDCGPEEKCCHQPGCRNRTCISTGMCLFSGGGVNVCDRTCHRDGDCGPDEKCCNRTCISTGMCLFRGVSMGYWKCS